MKTKLNARKKELLDAQEKMLNSAATTQNPLTPAEEESYGKMTKEIESINLSVARFDAVEKGKREVGTPATQLLVTDPAIDKKKNFWSKATNCSPEYAENFWKAFSQKNLNIQNAALGEGGTAADGSYLVPSITDPSIPALAVIEASARSLSRVITTEMDIKLPYQSARGVATQKAESTNSGTNAFATNVPNFATTTLTAYMGGDSIYVSWELMQDVKALSQFVEAELNRMIFTYEENAFINGSGSGAPLGYTNGAVNQSTAALTINTVLDLISSIRKQYYANAHFLFNRTEFHRLFKAQIASSQFIQWVQYDANGVARLLGFPVDFSSELATYTASPSVSGQVLFGDFAAGWVIGDRGDSNIRVKVLDQVAAVNGQTVVLGYRRTDQRNTIQECVGLMTTSS